MKPQVARLNKPKMAMYKSRRHGKLQIMRRMGKPTSRRVNVVVGDYGAAWSALAQI
jgi:hypothetical protein